MAPMTVKLPDGIAARADDGATGADAAAAIGPRLAKAGARRSRSTASSATSRRRSPTARRSRSSPTASPEALELIRHDAAHVLATAVLELYPGTKISIGPPIEDGFYYDFEFPDGVTVSDDDLERIEERMREHIKADEPFERTRRRRSPRRSSASAAEDQDYKVELIEDLVRDEGVETVSLYRNGPFTDLCRGPHAPSTGRIKAFKLNSVAGAYWRGDETRQMLTRIYGTAFFSKQDLERAPRAARAGARARPPPPRPASSACSCSADEAPGMPFWLPQGHGAAAADRGARCASSSRKRGYDEIKTPQVLDVELWHRSGPLGQLPREHVLHRAGEREATAPLRAQADELPRRLPRLRAPSATPTATCRCGWPSSGSSRATSARACCTACCACAPSPRTTPTSSAR